MSLQTKKAREWIDANPSVTQVNVNAYVAMIEHAESLPSEIVAWLRAFNCGSLKLAIVVEQLAAWVEENFGKPR